MKPSISTTFLGRLWIALGGFIALNAVLVIGIPYILPRSGLSIDFNKLAEPLRLIANSALKFGSIQLLIGIALVVGGTLMTRKKRSGRWILQMLFISLLTWFLFLSVYLYQAREASQAILFSPYLPAGFGLLAMGSSIWALSHAKISAELAQNK